MNDPVIFFTVISSAANSKTDGISWGTIATSRAISRREKRRVSVPRMRALPESGKRVAFSIFRSVVLPDPLGPITASRQGVSTPKERLSRTRLSV